MNRKFCRVSESHNQPKFFRLFLWWVWWGFRWFSARGKERKWKTAIRIVLKVLNISLPIIIIKSNGDVMMLWKGNSFEWPVEFPLFQSVWEQQKIQFRLSFSFIHCSSTYQPQSLFMRDCEWTFNWNSIRIFFQLFKSHMKSWWYPDKKGEHLKASIIFRMFHRIDWYQWSEKSKTAGFPISNFFFAVFFFIYFPLMRLKKVSTLI